MVMHQRVLQHPGLETQVPHVLPHAPLAPLLVMSEKYNAWRRVIANAQLLPPKHTGQALVNPLTTKKKKKAKKATLGCVHERQQPSLPVCELEWSRLQKHLPSDFLEVQGTCDFHHLVPLDDLTVGSSLANFPMVTSARESLCFSFLRNQSPSTFLNSNLLLFYKESDPAYQKPATGFCK